MDINDGKYIVEYDKKEQVWIVQNASIIEIQHMLLGEILYKGKPIQKCPGIKLQD